MTVVALGWVIAGASVIVFVTLWLVTSYRELSEKYKSLASLNEQVQTHRILYMQERGGANEIATKNILDNKYMIYQEMERNYNKLLRKPINRIPSYILGFRPVGKGKVINKF